MYEEETKIELATESVWCCGDYPYRMYAHTQHG